jgi:hypothetical protein
MAAVGAHPFRMELEQFRTNFLQVLREQQVELIALRQAVQESPVTRDRLNELRDIARGDIQDGDLDRILPALRVPEVG